MIDHERIGRRLIYFAWGVEIIAASIGLMIAAFVILAARQNIVGSGIEISISGYMDMFLGGLPIDKSVDLYELLNDSDDSTRVLCQSYEEALAAFERMEFQSAGRPMKERPVKRPDSARIVSVKAGSHNSRLRTCKTCLRTWARVNS